MKKLLPLILVLIGVGGGVGAGIALRPAPQAELEEQPAAAPDISAKHDYIKMGNQFVVPLLSQGRVTSMIVISLSLEVQVGATDNVYLREPKLRDSFLQVMFDHANTGGFDGSFTDGTNLVTLRKSLLEAAQQVLGATVSDVLIVEIMRQDN
ncbi:flagellar basal body-associated FliL family protein [Falsirhodobacter deserti]|uniref:flagellar basal body-associated FliL family protein n=1 Tax=Falsirhodobacter deserti TaxID=1365611 RepID=UPI000FE38680